MIPGPTLLKACPVCGGLIKEFTLLSGNTLGARLWTDGKRRAPMLPERPALVECPHCGGALWLAELATVGKYEPGRAGGPPEAATARVPDAEGYQRLLAAGGLSTERERYVRLRRWWAGNDARRQGDGPPLSEEEAQNLDALAALLDEGDDQERLVKAEIRREQGHFDQALHLLEAPFDPRLQGTVETIRRLAQQRQATVAELTR